MTAMPFANAPHASTASGAISGPRPWWMGAGEWSANTDPQRRALIAAGHPDYSVTVLRARLRRIVVASGDALNGDDLDVLERALRLGTEAERRAARDRALEKEYAADQCALPVTEASGWGRVDDYGDPVEEAWEREIRERCQQLRRGRDLLMAASHIAAMLAGSYTSAQLSAARGVDALEVSAT